MPREGTLRDEHGRWRPLRESLGEWRPSGWRRGRAFGWCHAPGRSVDPDPGRPPGWSPAAYGQGSTPRRLLPARDPPATSAGGLSGRGPHPWSGWLCLRSGPGVSGAARSRGQQADGLLEVRAFGTLTREVLAWSEGLPEAGRTPVALERTGESWPPVANLREGTVRVPGQRRAGQARAGAEDGPGRCALAGPTEAVWLLPAHVMPAVEQRARRDRTRDRTPLVQERTRESNRGPGVLERANITLASVATASRGVSGRAIRAALLEGRPDPATRAALATGRWRRQSPVREQALTGLVRDHHRRLLAMPGAHSDVLEAPLEAVSADLTRRLTELRAAPTPPSSAATAPPGAVQSAAEFTGPALPLTEARAVTVLDTMAGVDPRGADLVGAEWGLDRGRVETAARVAAWSGVAPGTDERAGNPRSGKTRNGPRALRTGLTPLAPAAALTQGTAVSASSHRLAARRGKPRAILAVAHSLVVSACPRLSRHAPYHA